MKTKFKNKLRYVAAGIFMLGLVANVSLSLTDPFVHVGTDLLAQTSGSSSGSNEGSSSGGTSNVTKWVNAVECDCDNGKKGHTLKCLPIQTTGETCTTDPLSKCYRLNVTLIPLSANPKICD